MDDVQSRIESLEAEVTALRRIVSSLSLQISDQNRAQDASEALSGDRNLNNKNTSASAPSKLSLFHSRGDIRSYFGTRDPRFEEDAWLYSEAPGWSWISGFLLWAKAGANWSFPHFVFAYLRHENAGECLAGESCDHWKAVIEPAQGSVQLQVLCINVRAFRNSHILGSTECPKREKIHRKPTFFFNAMRPNFKALEVLEGIDDERFTVLMFRVLH
ncbi:uncharacterized protein BKA55DRAFT_705463 [Fusarium redolens]|uniref:Uncharacterized protein n=1 Tax=Fusarium redolens TaxID=48865 RepID=A0A9P9GK88_FUSRE|nr:uncharacterized protein BKA55DRAFT_705463 [Fusarium redolens]KAH7240691.1 hypothetical protein BKA55DRAFT_705463 [Fusarium redolens]